MTNSKTEQAEWFGDRDDLARRLAAEYGCTPEQADACLHDWSELHVALRDPFLEWMRTGSLETAPEVEGYTIEKLVTEHLSANVPLAFLMLSHLTKDPKAVLGQLEQRKRLQRNPIFISSQDARRQLAVIPQD